MNNIIILYSELMPYNIISYKDFLRVNKGFYLHVFCWDVEKKLTKYEAPQIDGVSYYLENKFNQKELIHKIEFLNPMLLVVSGRMEKKYLGASKFFRKKGIKIIGCTDEV